MGVLCLFIVDGILAIMTKLISTTGGTFHREEFSFIRLTEGPYKGEGREKLVKPVIERWRKYIETVYKIEQSDKLAQHTLSYWDVFLEEMHDINAGTSYVCLLFMAIFYFWACVVVYLLAFFLLYVGRAAFV